MLGSPQGFFSSMFMRAINFVRDFLFSRGGILFVSYLFMVMLVWFAGPYVGLKSVSARLWVLLVITLVIALVLLVKWIMDRQRGKRLQRDIDESAFLGTRADRESEIAMLRKQMQDAINALKTSELVASRTGSAALYALPWYMVIGPSAVGKSSILRNSNLNFPYSKHDPRGVQGVGGTRNCDWWFSDQAVFLDTAGRYVTEEDDREEWFSFLTMLRNHRGKQPINGAIVAVNIADILTGDSASVVANAKIVRDRVDELVTKLGIVFPVYLIFTKSDLLKGFASYFDDLSEKERDQVWGACLYTREPNEKLEIGELFAQELDALHARLCAHRMLKLPLQRDVERKAEIMDMPNQFKAAGARLTEFVTEVFKKSPYRETPLFGGFFFTSATQQGTPIQYLFGTETQAFGAVQSPADNEAKGEKHYFIHNLLREVILPNSKQVARNKRMTRRAIFFKRFWIVVAIIAAITGVWMLSNVYSQRVAQVADIKDTSQNLAKNIFASRPNLGTAYKSISSYYNQTMDMWTEEGGMGFMTPGGLQEPLAQNFLLGMQGAFLYPVADMLEEHLNNYSRNIVPKVGKDAASDDPINQRSRRTATAYDELKLYLYLSSPNIVDYQTLIDPFTDIWMAALKRAGIKVTEQDRPQLVNMLTYYVKHMRDPARSPLMARAWSADKSLIASVRAVINQQPISDRLYAEMRDQGARKFEPIDLKTLVNGAPGGALTSSFNIPGIYSRRGWENFVWPYLQKTIDESIRTDWVLGNTAENSEAITGEARDHLVAQVRQMYFDDYVNLWFKMIEGISARRFETLRDASAQLQALNHDDNSFQELLKSINYNVALPDVGKTSLLTKGLATSDGKPIVDEIRQPFASIITITQDVINDKDDSWFSNYMKSLTGVQKEVAKLASSGDVPRDTKGFSVKVMNGDSESELYKSWLITNQALENADTRTAQAMGNLVRAPLMNVWATIVGMAQKDIDKAWRDKVLFAYNDSLRGKFPFASDGSDAPMSGVVDFFRPASGTFWGFIGDIGPFLERKGNSWQERKWMGVGMDFSPEFLQSMRKSSEISDGMFKRGDSNPNVNLSIYPYPSASLNESGIGVDGSELRYRNGPQEWQNMTWPGPNPGAHVRAVRAGTLASAELSVDGPWAMMHLIDKAHIGSIEGDTFMATWSLQDSGGQRLNASFRIRADRGVAMLTGSMQSYHLPVDIFTHPSVQAKDE